MFDSLDDQMKHDAEEEHWNSREQRLLRWTAIAVLSVLVVGGFYFGLRLLR